MGNCASSKLRANCEDEPVSLCRQRKRLLKLAVDRRQDLADSHQLYIRSIHAVAGAINLFVARHSSPSPALITLPSSSPPSSSSAPSFLRQTPTELKTEVLAYCSSVSSVSSSSSSAKAYGLREDGEGDRHVFVETQVVSPWGAETYGWDFFNPFEGVMTGASYQSLDDELRAVREREGIPDLEQELAHESKKDVASKPVAKTVIKEEKEGEGGGGRGASRKEKELSTGMEITEKKVELLDALKDVEDEFLKAFDSGKELARMLEIDVLTTQPLDDEIKDNSSKLIQQAITWHRSFSSLSSSSRSSLLLDRKNSSRMEGRSELFDDYGGMDSGSHSQTVERLYAWEKKLYEEVKTVEKTRQKYHEKCLKLQNHDAKDSCSDTSNRSRAAAKGLCANIWVTIRTVERISKRIEKVLDDELYPQIIELVQGLMSMWGSMLWSHERQRLIMSSVKAFTCPSYGRYCSDSQRQVTKMLEEQFENWRSCFKNVASAQRSYAEALDMWHSKFFMPGIDQYSRVRSHPLCPILREWSSSSPKLRDQDVSVSMKGFIDKMKALLARQWEEQQQKRKIDALTKDFDEKMANLQKNERRVLEFRLSELKPDAEVEDESERLAGRKHLAEICRQKLEVEKARHQNCMQETTEATLSGFKSGLNQVFESLSEFSRDSVKLYGEILTLNERAKVKDGAIAEKTSNLARNQ